MLVRVELDAGGVSRENVDVEAAAGDRRGLPTRPECVDC
ncbi:hypothetical protein Pd630_LPD07659 [Rhodococcus opacus PD630]|nr:hypothetical protein Pd630_LPD07659 [Rhodococcus opacus PD630]